jgi:hypothetical protein
MEPKLNTEIFLVKLLRSDSLLPGLDGLKWKRGRPPVGSPRTQDLQTGQVDMKTYWWCQ